MELLHPNMLYVIVTRSTETQEICFDAGVFILVALRHLDFLF